jgi:hypothetical protein
MRGLVKVQEVIHFSNAKVNQEVEFLRIFDPRAQTPEPPLKAYQ